MPQSWVFLNSSFFLLPKLCQNRIQILMPAPGLLKGRIQGRPRHMAAECKRQSSKRAQGLARDTREKHKGYNVLVGPPWFSHQNNHVSGWLMDKCKREHRKSFLPKENERPISSVSWQPWATVGSYWILSELHQGAQEERVMVKSSLEEGWNRLSPLVFTMVQCYFPWDGLGPNPYSPLLCPDQHLLPSLVPILMKGCLFH